MSGRIKLNDGFKAAVIGGGPAGSLFAHFLIKLSRKKGITGSIDIYDGKSFSTNLPRDCNMCAGVLGYKVIKKLFDEGINLDERSVRQEINGYAFHLKERFITLYKDPNTPIYSVFRGIGPLSSEEGYASFDRLLLDKVVEEGACWKKEVVKEIRINGNSGISLVANEDEKEIEYDFVAGAFGVNTNFHKKIPFGYVPPATWHACQAEIVVDEEFVDKKLGNMIHLFNFGDKKLKFIAITPKKNILTLTAIGEHVKIADLKDAIQNSEIKNYLPSVENIVCHCHPKLPVTSAKQPYYDRMAIIGDACDSRYLKNGIESAYYTAFFAADAVVNYGIDAGSLKKHFYKKCRRMFNIDNKYGKIMFFINDHVANNRFLASLQASVADIEHNRTLPSSRHMSKCMWYFFSGEAPYKWILLRSLHPRLLFTFFLQFFVNLFSELKKGKKSTNESEEIKQKIRRKIIAVPHYTLDKGGRVLIIGGGPAGASCAITLLKLAAEKKRDIKVTIFEGKDFSNHFNQCMGILSPDAMRVLYSLVGVNMPQAIFRSRIEKYVLCTDEEEIDLIRREDNKPFYTVRRVEMDRYLLNYAKALGAEVIHSRVYGVEFPHTSFTNEVRVYSESSFRKADVVVGAFGLDDAMLEVFEYATDGKYRRPAKVMKTFLTKIDVKHEEIDERFRNGIYAFLLSSLKNVEFGAVVPKYDYIVVNIAGRNITSKDMDMFLMDKSVRNIIPKVDYGNLKYYSGTFPISYASGVYGDRYVIVGNATGWVKPFKSHGIDMALMTGVRAAEVIFNQGYSEDALSYYAHLCKDLVSDYYYGAMIRYLCTLGSNMRAIELFVRYSRDNRYFYDILYNTISGDKTYREIALNLLQMKLLKTMIPATLKSFFRRR
ncbi:MAG: hypothetical protein D6734_07515 [Candidatus Schekmanbacteria bacterium]|nr:MAG: hypothetical protein D6734_07515 [Candidatus Schekmanbacteria bacterium]